MASKYKNKQRRRAVLPGFPNDAFSRFTPNAAQRRLDSTCGGSCLALMLRLVFLSHRAASTDLPPSACGFKSVIGCRSLAKLDAVPASTVNAGTVFRNVLRFILFSNQVSLLILRIHLRYDTTTSQEYPKQAVNHSLEKER